MSLTTKGLTDEPFWEGALSRSSTAIKSHIIMPLRFLSYEPVHEISDNVVCATSKASGQPTHTRSLIRAFACRLNII